MGNNRLSKMSAKLFEPVDVSSLVFFRVVFGLIMLWEVFRYWPRIERYYLLPKFQFKFFAFSWVKVLPGAGMYYVYALLGILACLITLGLFYRIAAALYFLTLSYVFLLDKTYYLNHIYLICLISFLLILIPCNSSFSLDALINPKVRSQTVPIWCVWLFRLQIAIPYFYGGLAKLNPDWFRGEPLRTWLAAFSNAPIIGQFFTKEWVVYLFTFGGLSFDLLIVPLLLFRRTRLIGYIWAVMFHLMNSQLFRIGIFPWMMIPATLIFFPPSWPRQLLARVQRKEWHVEEEVVSMPEITPLKRSLTTYFLILYVSFQLLMPFRQALYPGTSSWTREGYLFSWNMRLDRERGLVTFYVIDPDSYETWEISRITSLEFLTTHHYNRMVGSPDMILEFSHYLARFFKGKGFPNVEVRARAVVSLNKRPYQLLIDPKVNLAKVNARLWPPASWIIPHNELK
jgi:hypothetical protein